MSGAAMADGVRRLEPEPEPAPELEPEPEPEPVSVATVGLEDIGAGSGEAAGFLTAVGMGT